LNTNKPIWTRTSKEVTDEEYINFYKSVSKDTEDPLKWIHFSAEGDADFKSILYIPGKAPYNLFDPHSQVHRGNLKLYVRRVFITDDFEALVPSYLKFIRGVVDSDDLPLNVSREMLQQSKILKQIEKKIVRKAIAMFQELATAEDQDQYRKFWENYGTSIKLGVVEDSGNRSRLTKLLLFHSSKTGNLTTFDDYISRAKEGQEQIYFLAGTSIDNIQKSPLIEKAIKRGYEVLYMVDPIDEYAVQHIQKYESKYTLTNLGKDGVKFDDNEEEEDELKKVEEEFAPLTEYLKETFSDKIERAIVSDRLSTSPAALVSSMYGFSANMERIMRAQALQHNKSVYNSKKILEINPNHPIIKELLKRIVENGDDESAKVTATVLYETAVLSSGFNVDDPARFAGWIHRMMALNLNIDPSTIQEPSTPTPTPEGHDEL